MKRLVGIGICFAILSGILCVTVKLACPPPPLPEQRGPAYTGPPVSRLVGNIRQGKQLRKVVPSYPELARAMRWRPPFVKMLVTVGEDGKVRTVDVRRGHPLCNDAAIRAVMQWRYRPALMNGNPISFGFETILKCGDPYNGKLDPDVATLIDKFRRGQEISQSEFPFVHGGDVNLDLTIRGSEADIEQISNLGFVILGRKPDPMSVSGHLPIQHLDALYRLATVTFIAPHRV